MTFKNVTRSIDQSDYRNLTWGIIRHYGARPQWYTPLIRHYANSWYYYQAGPYQLWQFYLIARGFNRAVVTSTACQQRMLTPPDTLSCPILGLACALVMRLVSPERVMFPGLWISNVPRYFYFAQELLRNHLSWSYYFASYSLWSIWLISSEKLQRQWQMPQGNWTWRIKKGFITFIPSRCILKQKSLATHYRYAYVLRKSTLK